MLLIDLKNAYFQISIHSDSQPYLLIALGCKVYQFKALCFGLSTALQVFTRVFARVLEWVHGDTIGRLVCDCGIGSSLASPSRATLLALSGPGHVHQSGEVRF